LRNSFFDIIVVGGGTAGVSAAISAAREGCNVAIIEKESNLGGLAVFAEVGTICGVYKYSMNSNFEYNVGLYAESFTEELKSLSKSSPIKGESGLKFLPYVPKLLASQCTLRLKKNKVNIFLNSKLSNVSIINNSINKITFEKKGVFLDLKCLAVIDSTGKSLVSRFLKLQLIPTLFKQSASQIFTLSNLKFKSELNLRLVIMRAIKRGVLDGELKEDCSKLYPVPGSFKMGEGSFKITVPQEINQDTDALQSSALFAVHNIFTFLRSNVDGFLDSKLKSIAPKVGVRVDDRPVGKYILASKDVLSCYKPKDFIAYGNWPIEIWSQKRRVEIRRFRENDYYGISAKSLISNSVNNLFFAGRNISATDTAIASARVIGTCLQTGYASGKLAVGKLNDDKILKTISNIQKEQF
tara:strand:+ start:28485 stop:29717 length:1233 start_codon:yes stop_codon:yes gene_type:complete